MKHKHHIKPRYEGGSDDPENLVELTPIQHAMWHYAEWQRKNNLEDYLAWRGLTGHIGKEDILLEIARENGRKLQEWLKNNSINRFRLTGSTGSFRSIKIREKISQSMKRYREENNIPRIAPPVGSRGVRGRKPKPVELLSPCSSFALVFESAVKAGERLNLNPSAITKCARGVWTNTSGWKVRYI
jgi:hypothetical protein